MSKQTAINIGASKEAIKEAKKAILEIIKVSVADSVKNAALATLSNICNVNNTTITGCSFTQGK